MVFWTEQRKADVRKAETQTYELLQELGQESFKRIRTLEFSEKAGTADCTQVDGQQGKYLDVRMFAGDADKKVWAVAHELGHGVHELYRGPMDTCGESWAEAIRYFTESRYNPGSDWLRTGPPPQDRNILDACGWDWGTFKRLFATHQLLP
ncbi:MAG: hypothetical protein FJ395_21870 [Verrucomicrobia bacterium]|nr:hypothetical protein [Verrucomicrobiota bacterium]